MVIQKIKKYLPSANTVTLNKFTKGQAITCLEGLKYENPEKPLTIGSCDTGIMFNDKKFFKLFYRETFSIIDFFVIFLFQKL